jgi:hypothetical protein
MSVIHEANPSVEDLREALSDRGVVGRDDLDGLVDFAAIGLTLLWWRNTPIEGWHAGGESALSDGEMFRISTHTTWKLGEHLRTWLADYGVRTVSDLAAADRLLPNAAFNRRVRSVARGLGRSSRRLIIGVTLLDVAEQLLTNSRASPDCDVPEDETAEIVVAEYAAHATRMAESWINQCYIHGFSYSIYSVAAFGSSWGQGWWGTARWPAQVDALFRVLDDPGHDHWCGEHVPPPPGGTPSPHDLRRILVTAPWTLSSDTASWLTDEVGLQFAMRRGRET